MKIYLIQNKTEEGNIIKHIMTNNQYPEDIFHKINRSQNKRKYIFQSNDKDNNKQEVLERTNLPTFLTYFNPKRRQMESKYTKSETPSGQSIYKNT
jgi:hypothetical protein